MNLSNAATLFTDGFESGTLSKTPQNGVAWIDSNSVAVSNNVAASGTYSLRFNFAGVPLGEDSWAEQRISMPQKSEYWFKYKLFIPSNYTHRADEPSNNKFLAIYQAPYLKDNPGFQVNFSLWANGSGGSDLYVHYYTAGTAREARLGQVNFITATDRGKWMELIAQVKVPSGNDIGRRHEDVEERAAGCEHHRSGVLRWLGQELHRPGLPPGLGEQWLHPGHGAEYR